MVVLLSSKLPESHSFSDRENQAFPTAKRRLAAFSPWLSPSQGDATVQIGGKQ
jgi:hypothetical protein